MATKTLYVGGDDAPLWDAAQRVAKRRRTSLSRIVAEALAEHLPHAITEPTQPPTERWASIAPDAA